MPRFLDLPNDVLYYISTMFLPDEHLSFILTCHRTHKRSSQRMQLHYVMGPIFEQQLTYWVRNRVNDPRYKNIKMKQSHICCFVARRVCLPFNIIAEYTTLYAHVYADMTDLSLSMLWYGIGGSIEGSDKVTPMYADPRLVPIHTRILTIYGVEANPMYVAYREWVLDQVDELGQWVVPCSMMYLRLKNVPCTLTVPVNVHRILLSNIKRFHMLCLDNYAYKYHFDISYICGNVVIPKARYYNGELTML